MDSDELRALQAPLKDRYRTEPITLRASGALEFAAIACRVETGGAIVAAALHPASGGGAELCSGDMLLEALVACAGVTLKAVAAALGVGMRSGAVRAEVDLDFRGTLGVAKNPPVGFSDIRLAFELETDAPQEARHAAQAHRALLRVVLQTLKRPPSIEAMLLA